MPKITAIDLFCGAGGLTCGLERAGIEVRLGIDNDRAGQYAYNKNNKSKFITASVKDINRYTLLGAFDNAELTLLAGCPPCQCFSPLLKRRKDLSSDERYFLLDEFTRLIDAGEPDLITMENIPQLKDEEIYSDFIANLKELKYSIDDAVINCADLGLPQKRKRLVLIASRICPVALITPGLFHTAKQQTVRDAIAHLPAIKAGETHYDDNHHRAASLSALNMKRMKAAVPGQYARDIDPTLRTPRHKKKDRRFTYNDSTTRLEWDRPAPTITTKYFQWGCGRYGHPEQDRSLSLREGALLQGFPERYQFCPPDEVAYIEPTARLVGNAVPPILGEIIGKSLINSLKMANAKKDLTRRTKCSKVAPNR